MPKYNRSCFTELSTDPKNPGFICNCYKDWTLIDSRHFKTADEANNYGEDWVNPSLEFA